METPVALAVWALCGWACYQMTNPKTEIKSYGLF